MLEYQKITNSILHCAPQRPYYIFAPDYRRTSTGICVLHLLCHALNLSGNEAYVTTINTNPKLRTPTLTQDIRTSHQKAGIEPIVVYPEVTFGNPLQGKSVVRYLLNHPGRIGGPSTYPNSDFLVSFNVTLLQPDRNQFVLYLPPTDVSVFNNFDNPFDNKRSGTLLYLGRHKEGLAERQEIANTATLITYDWPASHQDLADLFRKSKVMYAFEQSNVALEAALCGCPTIFLKSRYNDGKPLAESELGRWGWAFDESEEQIAHAFATVDKMWESFCSRETIFWEKLNEFVKLTQPLPLVTPLNEDKDTGSFSDKNYQSWLKRTSLQEIDGQLLAERMMKQWKRRPHFNIVIEARLNEENLLADTIDSIAAQWYADWHLTLVTEFSPDDTSLAELPQVTWAVRTPDESIKQAMDEMITNTPGDWLLLIEPGCTLEAHALAYFADTINFSPDSRLLYCDEDVRNEDKELAAPRFKPDFNLELLRNMYYLGPALAIRKDAFESTGGWSSNQEAALYDLCLRVLDNFGHDALTHQRDMLLHTPEKCLRPINSEAEQNAVRAHIDRNQIKAKIESGFLQGTQKITYTPQDCPLVSIIIPTRDQPGYLSHCIDSIATQTLYPNWELILVDHATQDPDALDYIQSLLETPPFVQPVKVVRTDDEFNYARLCNLGANEASGEFLLFLDNDTEIIQPNWLEYLLGYLQQPSVAAVTPRLSQPDGQFAKILNSPRMLGVGGLANGILAEPTSLVAPGYCGRLQVAQDCSALSGSCFAINAAKLTEVGGFNEKDTPAIESILDICLRLRQLGLRLIWTPWVDVAHHDAVTRKRLQNDPLVRSKTTEQILSERDYFSSKYIELLKDDPYYHRHLSLNAACSVEPNAVIDWDTRFHDRLRILGLPLTSGSGEYRMTAPFRALQQQGLAQANIVHPIAHKIQRVLTPIELARYAPDTLMLQQAIDDVQINQLKRYRKFTPEVFITYAVDDVLGNLPRKHYLYNFQAREGKSRMREGLSHCDRLIVSTTPIADYCKEMINDIVVVPNRLERSVWCQHTSLRGSSNKPRVGWAGAQQHLGDLELIKDVVKSLAEEVDWIFMGMCPDFLKPYVKEEHNFVAYADYPAKLASLNLDLAIAPLEKHLFNEGKSNLRLLEYGIMGWPVICTDIYPYQTNHAPVKRVENTVQQWTTAIRERINDLDASYKEGDALRKWVLEHYILEDHIDEWLHAVTPSSTR